MFRGSRRISTTLIVAVTTAVAAITLATVAIEWAQRQAAMTAGLRQHAGEIVDTIDAALRDAMAKADSEMMASMLGRVGEMPAVRRVYLLDPKGKVAHTSDSTMPPELQGTVDFDKVARSKQAIREVRTERGRRFLLSLSPIAADESCLSCHTELKVGDATGYLGYERWADAEYGDLRKSQIIGVITGILTMLLIGVVLSVIVRRTTGPLLTMAKAAQQIATGDIEQTIDYRSENELGVLADSFRGITEYLRAIAAAAAGLSEGDLATKIEPRSPKDVVAHNVLRASAAIRGVLAESNKLTESAARGELSVRGDLSRFPGAYAAIVEGLNRTLDAVVGPLAETASYLERIAKGDIPAPIVQDFAGDFNTIKDNLNTCMAAIRALIADTGMLAEAAVAGRLSTRAEASKHHGDFARIVEGINRTLDSLLLPVHEAASVLQKVAERDLRARSKNEYKGDHSAMSIALNAAVSNLDEGLTTVADAAEQFAQASTQISQQSQELAGGASQQAATLSGIAGSLHDLSAGAEDNAGHAKRARAMAETTVNSAGEGLASITRLSEAIVKIQESAAATSKVVRVIDEIAFQTNLLALNAAVEAARAGDAGRGFAVVAEEVRVLARRSAESARSTSKLIEEAVNNAEMGVAVNRGVKKSFEAIHVEAQRVSTIMGEIVAASGKQSHDIVQVDRRVAEMSRLTQGTAATAEESASVAEELASQAEDLRGLVARFHLTTTSSGKPRQG